MSSFVDCRFQAKSVVFEFIVQCTSHLLCSEAPNLKSARQRDAGEACNPRLGLAPKWSSAHHGAYSCSHFCARARRTRLLRSRGWRRLALRSACGDAHSTQVCVDALLGITIFQDANSHQHRADRRKGPRCLDFADVFPHMFFFLLCCCHAFPLFLPSLCSLCRLVKVLSAFLRPGQGVAGLARSSTLQHPSVGEGSLLQGVVWHTLSRHLSTCTTWCSAVWHHNCVAIVTTWKSPVLPRQPCYFEAYLTVNVRDVLRCLACAKSL